MGHLHKRIVCHTQTFMLAASIMKSNVTYIGNMYHPFICISTPMYAYINNTTNLLKSLAPCVYMCKYFVNGYLKLQTITKCSKTKFKHQKLINIDYFKYGIFSARLKLKFPIIKTLERHDIYFGQSDC